MARSRLVVPGVTRYQTAQGERWRVRLRQTDPRTGKSLTHDEGGFTTEDAAQKRAQAMLVQWDQTGAAVDPSRMTVWEVVDEWLQREVRHAVRATTAEGYRDTCETHIQRRAIGKKRVQRLQTRDVTHWKDELLRETGPRTAQLAIRHLKAALTYAVGNELALGNVASTVKAPKRETEERRSLSVAEAERFLSLARTDHYWPLWHVYLMTGLRLGEGLGLRWQDVDLDRGTLWVRQQVVRLGKPQRLVMQPPKSKAGVRTLEIDNETTRLLYHHQEQQAVLRRTLRSRWVRNDLVFCTQNGLPIHPDAISKHFRTMRATLGWDTGLTVHSLRHSHASQLIQAKVPITEVARRLGHGNASVTLSIYAHHIREDGGYAVEVLEGLYRRSVEGEQGKEPIPLPE